MTDQSQATVVELDRDECLRLLATQPVGRLAVSTVDAPYVVPVNFTLDGECIVFRSDPGTKLTALQQGMVSFQVDFIDWYHRCGWSILARGTAAEAMHEEVAHLLLTPWAEGDKRHWIRIPIAEITGRRLDHIDVDWAPHTRGYL